MIKKFDEYIREYFSKEDVKFQNKDKSEVYTGFKKLGYKCIGNFFWTTKTYNSYISEPIKKFLNNNLIPLEKEVFGKQFFKWNDYSNEVDINYYSKVYKSDDPFVMNSILNNISNEKVVKIKDNGSTFYCFWNPTEKYYYYMSFKNKTSFYNNGLGYGFTIYTRDYNNIYNLFNNYIALKTEPLNKVKEKFQEIKIQDDERKQEEERIRKKREEEERIKKEKDDRKKQILEEVDNIKKSIEEDYKKNPDNYKEVESYSDIPEEIRTQIEEDDVEKSINNDYFKTYDIIEHGRYDDGLAQFYINTKDLSDGWTYKKWISWAKPGTYWGD